MNGQTSKCTMPSAFKGDPSADDHGWRDEERRRAEKSRERLGLQCEPVVAEHARQMRVRRVKARMMIGVQPRLRGKRLGCVVHDDLVG